MNFLEKHQDALKELVEEEAQRRVVAILETLQSVAGSRGLTFKDLIHIINKSGLEVNADMDNAILTLNEMPENLLDRVVEDFTKQLSARRK